MVVPALVNQALAGIPITVFGSGRQARCFSHVDDIVTGILAGTNLDKTAGEVFNLGSAEEISINQLAAKVKEKTGSSSPIVHIPYSQAYGKGFEDMERRVPDTRKAQEWFGFSHRSSLDEIVQSVVDHVRRRNLRQHPAALSQVAS
jgi:UDP-glucose 4-epimerase